MSPGMEQPTPPVPVGPKWGLKIFAAFLGAQMAVAVTVGLFARRASVVDPRLALGAALAGTLFAGLVALGMVRRTLARPGGAEARAAVGWRGASASAVARATLQGFAIAVGFAFVSAMSMGEPHNVGPLAIAVRAGVFARLAWAGLAIGLAPPLEELIFRGVLYAGFARSWRPRVAGMVTTALFVALHVPEFGRFLPGWLVIGMVGALALRVRVATGSLVPAIALHASYNFGILLVTFMW
jgi:membrane protease YdiL (CAAX protease family)